MPTAKLQAAEQRSADEYTPATSKQKLLIGVLLILASAVVVGFWFGILRNFESSADVELSVPWIPAPGVVLRPGPPEFLYDTQSGKLMYHGLIDAPKKDELAGLVPADKAILRSADQQLSYWDALNRLAYESSKLHTNLLVRLFWLAGLSGIVGVLMRSISNFLMVACFRNRLDMRRWWPWYVVRPVLGFFVGIVTALFIETDLFRPGGRTGPALWCVGAAILAGFGSEDFAERLRLLSKTFFGSGTGKSEGGRGTAT